MSIRDDVLGHLAKGPAKTSQIAEALNLETQQTSATLSALGREGRVARVEGTHQWALASGRKQSPADEPSGAVELMPASRVRRLPAPQPAPMKHFKTVSNSLEQQTIWAEKALDAHLEAIGDAKTKVLVDNLLAAKAAQLEWEKEA